jgi:hypothetical protein
MVHVKQTTEYLLILRSAFTPDSNPAADLERVVLNLSPLTSCVSTPDNSPVVVNLSPVTSYASTTLVANLSPVTSAGNAASMS